MKHAKHLPQTGLFAGGFGLKTGLPTASRYLSGPGRRQSSAALVTTGSGELPSVFFSLFLSANWRTGGIFAGHMTNYHSIGKIAATFGVKGEVVLHHQLGKKTSLKGLETIFIEEKKDEMLPYFLESTRIKNDEELF